jgi:sialidase-1
MSRLLIAVGFLAAVASGGAAAEGPRQAVVFRAGTDGYHAFRIPSVLVTPRGTVLAFCEGRKDGRGDAGDIDLVMKRSGDGGASWSGLRVIADDGPETVGNPCPVVDRDTGTIWMLLTKNLGHDTERQIRDGTSRGTRTVWVTSSTDDGVSWSWPVEITPRVKAPDWSWYATGPGIAIQLKSGRLLVPCDHFVAGTGAARSHVIFSDDHGRSWTLGGVVGGDVNECQVAERADGSLLLNMRNHPFRGQPGRAIATSGDGGRTWTEPFRDPTLIEPGCQASLLGRPDPAAPGRVLLLFSNPAATRRERMTVRASADGGRTWSAGRVLHAGPSGYSCLTALPDRTIGCLYERGDKDPYQTITFARFGLAWLSEAAEGPSQPLP